MCGPMKAYLWGRAPISIDPNPHISYSNKPPITPAPNGSTTLSADRCATWRTCSYISLHISRLRARGLVPTIYEKGKPAPLQTGGGWVVEHTNSWNNAHKRFLPTFRTYKRVQSELFVAACNPFLHL